MGNYNERKLSVIYDKRQKDFIIKYPRRCDGALINDWLLNKQLIWTLPVNGKYKSYPYNWIEKNLKEELERRGYDLKTLRFSIELKDE